MKRIAELDFQVTACTQDELKSVQDFAIKMWDKNIRFLPKNRTDILNKYRRFGQGTQYLNLFLLKYKNEIIGYSGYVPFQGLFGSKRLNGFVGTDVAIDPEYRKRFPHLAVVLARSYEKFVRKDKLFPLIFPNDLEALEAFKKVQWGTFAALHQLSDPLAAQFLPEIASSSIEIKRIEHFDKDIDAFFKRVSNQHLFLMNTGMDSLNWRYFQNPFSEYVVLIAVKKKEIVGYIVTGLKGKDICIVDLVVDLEYPRVMLLLIYSALKYYDKTKIASTTCCLSHKKYIEIINKSGFFRYGKIECLFFKVGLLYSQITYNDVYSSDKSLYHLNGFASHLY
jgi:hypothetical protein